MVGVMEICNKMTKTDVQYVNKMTKSPFFVIAK